MMKLRIVTLKSAVCILGCTLLLSACAPLLLGGMAGTAVVATDRRTSGIQLEDEEIELRAASRIREMFGDRVHVNVNSFNLQVLLTGEVPTDRDRQAVYKIVSEVENVRKILNEVVIGPVSSYADRSHDVLLSSKVKAGIIDAKDLMVNTFKIIAEHDNIYLMGRVTPNEANRATEIARNVGGVKQVVRVFQLLTDDELRAINPPISSGTPPSGPGPR
jgi:osmotically-inducible protein OsmY